MTPQHTAVWGKTLVDELKSRGFSPSQIAGNSGVRLWVLDQDEPKLSFDQLALLFERAAELTNDDLIGFRHGQNRDFRRSGLVAYVGLSSPTVQTLLENLSRYQRVSSDAIEIDTSKIGEGIVEWHFHAPRAVSRGQYVEFGAAGIIDALRRLTGRRIYPERIDFRHYRSQSDSPMRKYFGCPLKFGSDENRLTLKLSDLSIPLVTADNHLYRLMKKYCEEAIAKSKSTKPPLIAIVEEAIAKDITATQADVARRIGMSVRTLSRRLSDEGTSYKEVLEDYRAAMSRSMIDGSDMSFTEIAYVLGYADLSTFSSAFRRWNGLSPTQYRDRISKQAGGPT